MSICPMSLPHTGSQVGKTGMILSLEEGTSNPMRGGQMNSIKQMTRTTQCCKNYPDTTER